MSNDLYKGMSEFYDTFVQLNRDYKAIALELLELFGLAGGHRGDKRLYGLGYGHQHKKR